MSNQVTIKLDSRIFYLLIAFVAVVGIFLIGWWLGQQLAGPQGTAQAPEAQTEGQAQTIVVDPATGAQEIVVQPGGGAELGANNLQANPGQPPAAVAAGRPVSVDEVPVGDAEARLWIDDVAETNWTYDFGKIPADGATEKDFVVTNVGTAELVIEEATASCGCTAALVADSNLAPGESTTVRVSYDPRVNREQGKFIQKQVRIKSNDPLVPLAEFTITADVATE